MVYLQGREERKWYEISDLLNLKNRSSRVGAALARRFQESGFSRHVFGL